MKDWPDNCVDLVITDPPYGVRNDDWDNMDNYMFNQFAMRWISMSTKISKELITFCTSNSSVIAITDMLFPFVRRAIWHKPLGSQYAGSSEAKAWFSYEMILHCHNGRSKCRPKLSGVAMMIRLARKKIGLSRGGIDMRIRGKKTGLCYRSEKYCEIAHQRLEAVDTGVSVKEQKLGQIPLFPNNP